MDRLSWAERLPAGPLVRKIAAYLGAQGLPIYLVGGMVRDLLLGRPSYDLDFAVDGEAMALARRLADVLGGAYVPLDASRDVARVVLRTEQGQIHVDLARLRAEGIEADLRARDYTINALAVPIAGDLEDLLDPTGGRGDLAAGLLRIPYDQAFADDPLRILRGIRLRATLGFTFTAETEALARRWAPMLRRVSAERIRDELAQILALPQAAESLAYAGILGLGELLFPELAGEAYRAGVETVTAVERIMDDCRALSAEAAKTPWQPYAQDLRAHWAEELSLGRERQVAVKLAALWSGALAAEEAQRAGRKLRLSSHEIHQVGATIRSARLLREWADRGDLLAPVQVYRYYRAHREAGVDGALLALVQSRVAQDAATGAAPILLGLAAQLLRAWFNERATLVEPPPLLSGREIMAALGLPAGPGVGRLVEMLREAQVQGLVRTRDEALTHLRQLAGK